MIDEVNHEPQLAEQEEDRFGVCPVCGKTDGYINLGSNHWFICDEHRLMWCVGSNLFSDWKEETEEEQRRFYDEHGLAEYTQIPSREATRKGGWKKPSARVMELCR